MIEVKVTGKCIGCPALDIEPTKLIFSGHTAYETLIKCKNEPLCERLEKMFQEKYGVEEK